MEVNNSILTKTTHVQSCCSCHTIWLCFWSSHMDNQRICFKLKCCFHLPWCDLWYQMQDSEISLFSNKYLKTWRSLLGQCGLSYSVHCHITWWGIPIFVPSSYPGPAMNRHQGCHLPALYNQTILPKSKPTHDPSKWPRPVGNQPMTPVSDLDLDVTNPWPQ